MRLEALILGLLLALGAVTTAQAAGYTANITTAYPQLAISTSAPQVVWAAGNGSGYPSAYISCDDCASQVMPIGFTFNFAGTNYSSWSMSSNGAIFFETTAVGTTSTATASGGPTYTPVALPTNAFGTLGKPALMPFWADLIHNASVSGANTVPPQAASASFYQYQVLTVSGAQVLVAQLKNVGFWASPSTPVNMQVQIWSTGQIVYSYGTMQVLASSALLTIGLQYPGGGCNNLANNQSTSLSNQSYLFTWDTAAATCPVMPSVNHYEIREDGAATLCAEPVTVLACSSGTSPCPAASIINTQIINAAITVTGTGSLATPTISPPSVNILPSAPLQSINITWTTGTSGTATLGISPAVKATGAVNCTNVAGTSTYANCNMTVANTACIAPPNHYQITGPASGSTCANSTFTIKAWADAAETTAYTAGAATGTLTQTGNPASLPSLGAFSIPAGSSTVSITPISFPAVGTTTFNTTATPALAGATTCNFGGSTSCSFAASSATCVADFNCVETSTNAAAAPADYAPDTGRLYTKLAGTAFSFDVVARKSDGSTATSYLSDSGQSVTVSLVDGSSGAGATCTPTALSPAGPASQTLTFVSGDSGRKNITFTVPKAYQSVRCSAVDTNATVTKGCSQDNFAIRPPSATLGTSPAMATPPSASAASPIRAGVAFTLQATTSAGTNYNPTLTRDTSTTPAPKLTAQITTQDTTVASGGAVGTLTPASLTTNATAVNATYSEVGYLYLAAGAYYDNAASAFTAVDVRTSPLSSDCIVGSFSDTLSIGKYGCNIGTVAAAFGRFLPDHFETAILAGAAPTTPIGCPSGLTCPSNAAPGTGGFVYSNQPFTVQVTAKNTAGGTTTNYQNNFAKATTLSAWNANGGATANPGAGAMAGTAVASTVFANGVASTAVASYGTALPTLLAPTDVYFRAAEAAGGDGVTSLQTTAIEAGLKIASGRIRIPNAHGSEKLALPLPIAVQYFNGTNWVTSTTDNAMTFNSALTPAGNLTATLVAGPANCVSVNTPAAAAVASGVRTISLATNAVCSYNISLTGTPAYLPIATATGGRATFGIFKSPLIYRRENY